MFYTLVKPLGKTTDRFLCQLPSREWLKVGQYVIYIGEHGEDRIGVVTVPDFDADEADVKAVWGNATYNIVAELRRNDIEWPDDDMHEPIPEIE